MNKYLFVFLGLILSSMLSAQEQQTVYQTVKDIPYSSSDDAYARERCKLDVYYPKNLTDCPVVVWFHGGGLTSGNKSIPGRLQNCGMVVVAVNYRLLPKVDIAACLDDAAQAVAWTFREAGKYHGSNKKIFISVIYGWHSRQREISKDTANVESFIENRPVIMKSWSIMAIQEIHLEECHLIRNRRNCIMQSSRSLLPAPSGFAFRIMPPTSSEEAVPLTHPGPKRPG